MEQYIAISTINDFLYCPKSLYMHQAAGKINPATYHDTPQIKGNALHATINQQKYSTRSDILQGTNIFCGELGVYGKLDIFDVKNGELIERKTKVKEIYEGYLMQLYAEYYCLVEMGYKVKKIAIYSMLDNKKYSVNLPSGLAKRRLKNVLEEMRNFSQEKLMKHHCKNCDSNIYSGLSW